MKTEEIKIQPGCKKVEIDFENNRVIAFYEEEKHDFKRGDYYTSSSINNIVCIIEKSNEHNTGFYTIAAINGYQEIRVNDEEDWLTGGFRPSTPKEIALLDQKLLEAGYKFNKKTLELEKVEVFKDKELVLMRDHDDCIWCPNLYHSNSNDLYYSYTQRGSICQFEWKQCIKYAGNEHLLGTKNKPE